MSSKINWISIKDQLPERRKTVLCSGISKLKQNEPYLTSGYLMTNTDVFIVGNCFDYDIGKVLYWAELPELPEELKNLQLVNEK